MITKQEIIDYINDSIMLDSCDYDCRDDFNNLDECQILIKMIKDLKPKVKKFEFIEKDRTWFAYPNYQVYSNMFNEYSTVTLPVITELGEYLNKDKWHDSFKTLEQAQEACQKHYEENILGGIEF